MATNRWLLVWDLGGFTLRLTDAPEGATVDGELYRAGLDVGALPLAAEQVTVAVGWEPEGGWGAYVASFGPLEETSCSLYRHADGQTLATSKRVTQGVALDVQYGGPGEPLDFRLERRTGGQELMPPSTAAVTLADWSTAADSALGKNPPIIFGYPGTRGSSGSSLPCVPVHYVSVGGTGFLAIAQGSIFGTTATITRVAGGAGTLSTWSAAPVTETTKSGRTVSQIQEDGSTPASFFVDDGQYYLEFDQETATHGGVAKWDQTGPRRGAADVMLWVLEQYTSMRIDRARWDREADWLNAYFVDTYIDAPIQPLEWIERSVLPYLPARLRQGRKGLWLQSHRYTGTSARVVRELSVDRGDIDRVGRVGRRDPVFTRFSINYRYGRSRHYASRTLGPLPGQLNQTPAGFDVRELGRYDLRLMELRTGEARPADLIECAMTWDSATATRILHDQADRYGWPKRALQVVGGRELEDIEPGAIVAYSDSELGATDVLALVESPPIVSVDEVRLDLTLLDRPG